MNEVLKVIKERFSCRGYDGRPVEQERLEMLTAAALAAPSAMNLQPWRIIVITDKALVDRLDNEALATLKTSENEGSKAFYERIMERGGKVFYNAPVLYLILKDAKARWGEMDAGIMTQNISLAATAIGLDNVIVGMASLPFSGANAEELKALVNWPEGYDFGMGVLVGYGNVAKEPHELDYSKVNYIS